MAERGFPVAIEDVTPAWLTKALGEACGLRGAKVTSFEAEPIGVGTGFLGVVSRLRLAYDCDAPTAPKSVIIKLPSHDPGARMITSTFRHYEKEVRFYEQLARLNNLSTPTPYFHAFDHESGDFALILEDLAPARNGDQVAGLSIDDVRTAVIALAKMQAQWWERPALHVFDWLPAFNDPAMLALQDVFQQCWGPYREFLGDRVPAELIPVGDRLGGMITRIMQEMTAKPCTIVHGDYRADNFFFDRGGEPFTVVDWQIVIKGVGAFDLAYLLAGNITVEDRRKHEDYLVKLYHHHLVANGVEDYDFATCWRDYRTCVLIAWIWPVIGIGSLDPSNERGLAFFNAWSHRAMTAVVDLKAWETLDDF
jgi:aminoglycoside/choline kinase family phosphotransferase